MKLIKNTLLLPDIVRIVGVQVHVRTYNQILAHISNWIKQKETGHTIVVANSHVLMLSKENEALKEAVGTASLVIPDGMPLVLTARMRGFPGATRTDGPTLLMKALTESAKYGWRHYFLGSTPEVLARLKQVVEDKYPGACVVGYLSPPFRAISEKEDLIIMEDIRNKAPDILWVGLGCPKQEIWMLNHKGKVDVPLMVGVGMAFDILSGSKPRAPAWMQKIGLEWFYRLYHEPKRLWWRYLKYNTLYIMSVTVDQIRYYIKLMHLDP